MKHIHYVLLMACALIGFSCSSGGDEGDSPAPTPTPTPSQVVKFLPSLTRATATAFENGDQISVFAVHPSAGTAMKPSGNYADNVCYTYSGSAFTASDGIVLPSDGQGLAYYAAYPYSTEMTTQGVFTVAGDQRTHANITSSDFCTAYAPASNSTTVELKFSHRLSHIAVNLSGDNLASKTITMRLTNVLRSANIDLNANSFEGTGSTGTINMGETATNSFEAIIAPQTVEGGMTFLVVTIDGKEYPLSFDNETTFRSGKEYEYSLTYTENTLVVISGDINPWNHNDDRLNNVVPEYIQDKMLAYMPLYTGVNPPNVEGTYFIDPFETVYCEDAGSGGYDPGTLVTSEYIEMVNQNFTNNTLDFADVAADGSSSMTGNGAFISGSGNNFTAFFNTTGISKDIAFRTALVISGTKTTTGIKNLYYAFVMVEKGSDPSNLLMNEGVFRVFKDQDGLSVNVSASRMDAPIQAPQRNGLLTPWSRYAKSEK